MLFKVTNTLYPKSDLNHTVNIQSGLGLSRVVGEKKYFKKFGKVYDKISCGGKDCT